VARVPDHRLKYGSEGRWRNWRPGVGNVDGDVARRPASATRTAVPREPCCKALPTRFEIAWARRSLSHSPRRSARVSTITSIRTFGKFLQHPL